MCIEQTYLLTELFRYTYHGIISVKPRKDKLSYKILQFGNLFMNKIHLKDIHKLRLLNPPWFETPDDHQDKKIWLSLTPPKQSCNADPIERRQTPLKVIVFKLWSLTYGFFDVV